MASVEQRGGEADGGCYTDRGTLQCFYTEVCNCVIYSIHKLYGSRDIAVVCNLHCVIYTSLRWGLLYRSRDIAVLLYSSV